MSLYTPCQQEWLGRGTCLVNNHTASANHLDTTLDRLKQEET